jgi:hypothetical protein
MQSGTGIARKLNAAFNAPQTFWGTLAQPFLKRANRRGAIASVLPSASTGGRKRRERRVDAQTRRRGRVIIPLLAANATDAKGTATVRPYPPHERVCLRNLG